MDLQLTGSRVLVTGGTRGIGRAIVAAFAAEGAQVEFCARDAAAVTAAAEELGETGSAVDVGERGALAGSTVACGSRSRPASRSARGGRAGGGALP
ncbi:SDR family NAD(P)-dependent oxidoreductase [Goekera deserti]|uniref:SDR family NAD(P)-dependent oxidoreductase n=1 Tax=Goekera deserti TaxID=2497753 RepID=UPI001F3E20B1|nr:SDR family NAD(P)-dependent oxidoreductase [Goekera deserti]